MSAPHLRIREAFPTVHPMSIDEFVDASKKTLAAVEDAETKFLCCLLLVAYGEAAYWIPLIDAFEELREKREYVSILVYMHDAEMLLPVQKIGQHVSDLRTWLFDHVEEISWNESEGRYIHSSDANDGPPELA